MMVVTDTHDGDNIGDNNTKEACFLPETSLKTTTLATAAAAAAAAAAATSERTTISADRARVATENPHKKGRKQKKAVAISFGPETSPTTTAPKQPPVSATTAATETAPASTSLAEFANEVMRNSPMVSKPVVGKPVNAPTRTKKPVVNARARGSRFGLVQWQRLVRSSNDLAQRKGAPYRKDIQWDEIRKHNLPHDCWMVLRGVVYNIGPYLAYHPGGMEIFSKAKLLGEDGTKLFDKYHPWVSIEGLVGTLAIGSVATTPEEK